MVLSLGVLLPGNLLAAAPANSDGRVRALLTVGSVTNQVPDSPTPLSPGNAGTNATNVTASVKSSNVKATAKNTHATPKIKAFFKRIKAFVKRTTPPTQSKASLTKTKTTINTNAPVQQATISAKGTNTQTNIKSLIKQADREASGKQVKVKEPVKQVNTVSLNDTKGQTNHVASVKSTNTNANTMKFVKGTTPPAQNKASLTKAKTTINTNAPVQQASISAKGTNTQTNVKGPSKQADRAASGKQAKTKESVKQVSAASLNDTKGQTNRVASVKSTTATANTMKFVKGTNAPTQSKVSLTKTKATINTNAPIQQASISVKGKTIASVQPAATDASMNPGNTNATFQLESMETLDDKHELAIGDKLIFRIQEDKHRLESGEKLSGRTEDESTPLLVTDSGELEVPYIGLFPAENKTCKQLAFELKGALEKDYFYKATVILAVDLKARTRGRIYLTGAIHMPGPQEIPSDEVLTLGKAILRAGGFTDFAERRNVKVTRKAEDGSSKNKTLVVDVADVFDKGRTDLDLPLEPGDLILVTERLVRF